MCGIIGVVSHRPVGGDPGGVGQILIDGLKRLEYRGYDSAGIVLADKGRFSSKKATGKLSALSQAVKGNMPVGNIGLGHTRWATHGAPSCDNAHPHFACDNSIALVHNGVIENYQSIKAKLAKDGHKFRSETDTEIIVHLIEKYHLRHPPLEAVRRAIEHLEGSFAIGVIFAKQPNILIAARLNSPMIIGLGDKETFLASDIPAILPYTKKVIYLAEEQIAEIDASNSTHRVNIINFKGRKQPYQVSTVEWDAASAEKEGYPHFMLKEIFEQPTVVKTTARYYLDTKANTIKFPALAGMKKQLRAVNRIVLVACGTAYHASLVGKYAMEELCRLPVETAYASEFRYALPVLDKHTLVIAVSQSGETADTLAAIRAAKAKGAVTLAICNVLGSSITRDAMVTLYTFAGPEVSVASTKAYTTQLTAVILLSAYLAKVRNTLKPKDEKSLVREMLALPDKITKVLSLNDMIANYAQKYKNVTNFMYIARRYNLPNAFEGALKMKEISYTHAEGYGAGEMKHGPLALVDDTFPTVAIAVKSSVYDKIISNIQMVKARKGIVIAIATEGDKFIRTLADGVIDVPQTPEILSPILTVIPLQLLAYHTAVKKGRDVDQPRNLAKSVTVE